MTILRLMAAAALISSGTLLGQTLEIPYESVPNFLKLPANIHLGEVAGVATTGRGNLLVYTRTGGVATMGASRTFTHGGSRLFEFDAAGKYIREIGVGIYGFVFGEAVKVDPDNNIWVVDRGSNMIIKFDAAGRVLMTLGRKPESIDVSSGRARIASGPGIPGDNFNRPADLAWDAAGNLFVADSGNARIAKYDKNGNWIKGWGSKGSGPGQFEAPHSLAVDTQGNVYVADPGNQRIQVFNGEGTFKTQFSDIGAPRAICISGGAHPYLYSSNSNPADTMDGGEIYKTELDGHVLGKLGRAGKLIKEFGSVNQIDCRNPSVLYVGELGNWRVQKLTLAP